MKKVFGFVVVTVFAVWFVIALHKDEERQASLKHDTQANDPAAYSIHYFSKNDGPTKAQLSGQRLQITIGGDILTASSMKSGFLLDQKYFVPNLFTNFPSLNSVEMVRETKFTSTRGQQSVDPAIRITWKRPNAASIQWDNVLTDNLPILADEYWEHPSISK